MYVKPNPKGRYFLKSFSRFTCDKDFWKWQTHMQTNCETHYTSIIEFLLPNTKPILPSQFLTYEWVGSDITLLIWHFNPIYNVFLFSEGFVLLPIHSEIVTVPEKGYYIMAGKQWHHIFTFIFKNFSLF